MTVTRHDDLSLRYVMNVPTGQPDDAPLPLVVIMHGRGADANDLADIAPMIDGPGGYRFLFPNASRPFEAAPGMTFGFTWFDGLPPDRLSILDSREKLLRFIGEVTERYRPPDGKVVLAGFSQGGVMAIDVGFRTAEPLPGIVVMSGAMAEDDLPDLRARAAQPILIVHGLDDDMIRIGTARRARLVLEEHGVRPEYHEFVMGHHVTEESMEVVGEFIARAMKSGPPLATLRQQDDSK
jgi:phospholipase/carboxylesterase